MFLLLYYSILSHYNEIEDSVPCAYFTVMVVVSRLDVLRLIGKDLRKKYLMIVYLLTRLAKFNCIIIIIYFFKKNRLLNRGGSRKFLRGGRATFLLQAA